MRRTRRSKKRESTPVDLPLETGWAKSCKIKGWKHVLKLTWQWVVLPSVSARLLPLPVYRLTLFVQHTPMDVFLEKGTQRKETKDDRNQILTPVYFHYDANIFCSVWRQQLRIALKMTKLEIIVFFTSGKKRTHQEGLCATLADLMTQNPLRRQTMSVSRGSLRQHVVPNLTSETKQHKSFTQWDMRLAFRLQSHRKCKQTSVFFCTHNLWFCFLLCCVWTLQCTKMRSIPCAGPFVQCSVNRQKTHPTLIGEDSSSAN